MEYGESISREEGKIRPCRVTCSLLSLFDEVRELFGTELPC
jgi:hypothetical protein